jgi:hypothetical protein
MPYKLGTRSLQNLSGVNPDMVAVVKRAIEITERDFTIIEGIRHINRQRELFKSGKSQTMKSRHLTGDAIDLVPYPVSWEWEDFYPVTDAIIQACKDEDVALRWGGNWKVKDLREWEGTAEELVSAYDGTFHDLPHFEIPRA